MLASRRCLKAPALVSQLCVALSQQLHLCELLHLPSTAEQRRPQLGLHAQLTAVCYLLLLHAATHSAQ